MKRNIAIALASASLSAFSAHADVQSSFPDGYVIVQGDAAPLTASLPRADVQTSFPDGYVIVEADAEVRTPWLGHEELIGSFPQPSFVDYVARSGEAVKASTLAALERQSN